MIFGVFPGLDGAFGAKLRASHHRCFSNKHTAVIDILSLSSKETNLCSVCEESEDWVYHQDDQRIGRLHDLPQDQAEVKTLRLSGTQVNGEQHPASISGEGGGRRTLLDVDSLKARFPISEEEGRRRSLLDVDSQNARFPTSGEGLASPVFSPNALPHAVEWAPKS